MMLAVTERLMDRWDGERAAGRAVDVPGQMTKLTLEMIALTGFGHDFGLLRALQAAPLRHRDGRHPDLRAAPQRAPRAAGPDLLRGATRRNGAHMAYLNQTVDAVVAARQHSSGEGDLLDLMLETAHPETGSG